MERYRRAFRTGHDFGLEDPFSFLLRYATSWRNHPSSFWASHGPQILFPQVGYPAVAMPGCVERKGIGFLNPLEDTSVVDKLRAEGQH